MTKRAHAETASPAIGVRRPCLPGPSLCLAALACLPWVRVCVGRSYRGHRCTPHSRPCASVLSRAEWPVATVQQRRTEADKRCPDKMLPCRRRRERRSLSSHSPPWLLAEGPRQRQLVLSLRSDARATAQPSLAEPSPVCMLSPSNSWTARGRQATDSREERRQRQRTKGRRTGHRETEGPQQTQPNNKQKQTEQRRL
jgi:hypothetical protein